jgi:hypothetical protein
VRLLLILFLLATSAMSGELFRYRGAARDGGTLEYVFESDERDVPKTATKERVAEIAAHFMTTFCHLQVGALETQEFRQKRLLPSGSSAFQTRSRAPYTCTSFSCSPDGTVVEPRVARRL